MIYDVVDVFRFVRPVMPLMQQVWDEGLTVPMILNGKNGLIAPLKSSGGSAPDMWFAFHEQKTSTPRFALNYPELDIESISAPYMDKNTVIVDINET